MPRGRYRLDRVTIELKSDRPARWKIREEPLVRGTEFVYGVTDGNYAQRNEWEFLVRVPKKKGGSIEVRPSLVPAVKAWSGMDRRALMCERVRRGRNAGDCYCKVAPVRHTRGTDSDSLVIVVDPDDHQRMVALFLAAKAWCSRNDSSFAIRQLTRDRVYFRPVSSPFYLWMRVRILKSSAGVLDGVSLSRLIPGLIYDLKPITANYLISQRVAEKPLASERAAVIAPDNRTHSSQLFGGVRVIMPRAEAAGKPLRAKRRKR